MDDSLLIGEAYLELGKIYFIIGEYGQCEEHLKTGIDFFQKAGEKYAWAYLESFCSGRGANYSRYISKPLESRKSCGRISPYLAWGNISVKQAYQYVLAHDNYPRNKKAFNGMLTRLKWRCHFIQKFEVECSYETQCINKGYELMGYENDDEFLTAWKEGKTGFPLVDACMALPLTLNLISSQTA